MGDSSTEMLGKERASKDEKQEKSRRRSGFSARPTFTEENDLGIRRGFVIGVICPVKESKKTVVIGATVVIGEEP